MASVNVRLFRDKDWPDPWLVARLVNFVTRLVGKLRMKRAIRSIARFVRNLICDRNGYSNEDSEYAKAKTPEGYWEYAQSYQSYNSWSRAAPKKRIYFYHLLQIFGNRYHGVPDLVMTAIEHWETDRW